MFENPEYVGYGIKLDVDTAALAQIAHAKFELGENESVGDDFVAALQNCVAEYKSEYEIEGKENYRTVVVDISALSNYESQYKYVTGSIATDGNNYVKTDYTVDNDLIVIVTYSNGTDTRSFILNYNIYAVEVTLADGETPIVVDKYGFVRI